MTKKVPVTIGLLLPNTAIAIKKILVSLFSVLFFLSCGRDGELAHVFCEPVQWQSCDTICLQEEPGCLLGHIRDFVVIDSVILLTDGTTINLYDYGGRLLKRFGAQGHATSEYVEISRLYASEHHIYAWCGMSLKLLQYSWDGEFEKKYSGMEEAVYQFCVEGDSIVHYYLAGRSSLMAGRSLTSERILYHTEDFYPEDLYLLPYVNAGGMTMYGDDCLFVHASDMVIRKISGFKAVPVLEIKDKEFSVSPAKKRPLVARELAEYISKNSICTGLYVQDSRLFLTAETGVFPMEPNQTDYSKRFLHIIEMDSGYRILASRRYPFPVGAMRYGIFQRYLYGVTTSDDSVMLLRWQLP